MLRVSQLRDLFHLFVDLFLALGCLAMPCCCCWASHLVLHSQYSPPKLLSQHSKRAVIVIAEDLLWVSSEKTTSLLLGPLSCPKISGIALLLLRNLACDFLLTSQVKVADNLCGCCPCLLIVTPYESALHADEDRTVCHLAYVL